MTADVVLPPAAAVVVTATVEPQPAALLDDATLHRYAVVHASPQFFVNHSAMLLGGIVRVSKAGKRKTFIHAYLKRSELITNPESIAMDDQMRDNLDVRSSGTVKLEMANTLPYAYTVTFSPCAEDCVDLSSMEGQSLEEHLFQAYLAPYLRGATQNELPLLTVGQVCKPSNVNVPVRFKVVEIEPCVPQREEGDMTDHVAKLELSKMKGAIVSPNHFKEAHFADMYSDDKKDVVRFEDIGGLDSAIMQIREGIELPVKHPSFFTALGIKPTRGILISGPPGTGKTLIGKACAHELDCFFLVINGPEIMSKMAGDSESNLRKAFEEAEKNAPSIIFIDEIDSIAPKREKSQGEVEKRVVAQLLVCMDGVKSQKNVFVIGSTNRPNHIDPALRRFGRFSQECVIGVPNDEGRAQILKIHSRNLKLEDNIDFNKIIQDTQGYVGADIAQLCHSAAMQVCQENVKLLLDTEEDGLSKEFLDSLCITNSHFDKALSLTNPSSLREAQVEIPNVAWADVGGLEKVKKNLVEIIQWPIIHQDVMSKFGLKNSSGALFYGPPGCGKTLIAKAIASECKANFISIKGPELLTMYYGESESNIRDIFSKAKNAAPCVLFFDEIDSMAQSRGSSPGDSHVTDRVINTILTEMDGMGAKKNVFVIGATNRPDVLDSALLRPGRLDQIIYIPPPDLASRKQILKIGLKNTPVDENVNLDAIAEQTEGFSGADLHEVCSAAVRAAVREYMTNRMQQLSAAPSTDAVATASAANDDDAKNQESEKMEVEPEASVRWGHFVEALNLARKSIKDTDLRRYQQFATKMNASRIDMPADVNQTRTVDSSGLPMENDDALYE